MGEYIPEVTVGGNFSRERCLQRMLGNCGEFKLVAILSYTMNETLPSLLNLKFLNRE
jgi:hypothetical protein